MQFKIGDEVQNINDGRSRYGYTTWKHDWIGKVVSASEHKIRVKTIKSTLEYDIGAFYYVDSKDFELIGTPEQMAQRDFFRKANAHEQPSIPF